MKGDLRAKVNRIIASMIEFGEEIEESQLDQWVVELREIRIKLDNPTANTEQLPEEQL